MQCKARRLLVLYEILGTDGGGGVDVGILVCNAVWTCR
jgi:hypothetical protein